MPEAVGVCPLLSSPWHCVWQVPLTQHAMRPSCAQPSVSKTALNSFTSGRVAPFPIDNGANNNGLRGCWFLPAHKQSLALCLASAADSACNAPVLFSAVRLKNRFTPIYLWPCGPVANGTRSKQQWPEAVGFCRLLSSRWHCVWPVPLTQHANLPVLFSAICLKNRFELFTSGRVAPLPMEQGANNNS